eukprot:Lithocolla_globosa_v1_NODE_256_length_4785_cov_62.877137.p1 type:complete len:333 gc:universal NODE_256_length_4785_cov_62.877137:2091-3089(+)
MVACSLSRAGLVLVTLLVLKWFRGRKTGLKEGFLLADSDSSSHPYRASLYPGPDGDAAFMSLPSGKTRFYLHGPVDGKRVVCVHGISPPAMIFRPLVEMLASKGYRVLTFDLYGRGYSDSPDVAYDKELYCSQLALLTKRLGWDKFILFGFSLGGGISVAYASMFPESLTKLVLCAPAGLNPKLPFLGRLLQLPFVGEAIMSTFGPSIMKSNSIKNFASPPSQHAQQMIAICHKQVESLPGFLRAYLSTIRFFPLTSLGAEYAKVGQSGLPTLVIWGEADQSVPYVCAQRIMALLSQARLLTVKGGHGAWFENSTTTFPTIIQFMEEQSTKN